MSAQALERKKFVLYYAPEFIGGEKVELKTGMGFFTEEYGFRPFEIEVIGKVKRGDTINVGGPLRIWRVE